MLLGAAVFALGGGLAPADFPRGSLVCFAIAGGVAAGEGGAAADAEGSVGGAVGLGAAVPAISAPLASLGVGEGDAWPAFPVLVEGWIVSAGVEVRLIPKKKPPRIANRSAAAGRMSRL